MNKKQKEYLRKSVLKPYLIHVENEVLNILNRVKQDKIIRSAYSQIGFNIKHLEISINSFLIKLKQLERIFEFYL